MISRLLFLCVPILAIVAAKYAAIVFGYRLAARKWPKRDMLLQFVSLLLLSMMLPIMLLSAFRALGMVGSDLTVAQGWQQYLMPYNVMNVVTLFSRWLPLLVPAGICMLFMFGIYGVREMKYRHKLMIMIVFLLLSIGLTYLLLALVYVGALLLDKANAFMSFFYNEFSFRFW